MLNASIEGLPGNAAQLDIRIAKKGVVHTMHGCCPLEERDADAFRFPKARRRNRMFFVSNERKGAEKDKFA